MRIFRTSFVVLAVVALTACGREEPSAPAPVAGPEAGAARIVDPDSIARGALLFAEHCAQCHGPKGQGHPDWNTPSDGSFAAAPPLNGTGNDWKRSRAELLGIIKNGIKRPDGVAVMPAWKGRVTEQDMQDVMAWFQSLWPADVYARWREANVSGQQAAAPAASAPAARPAPAPASAPVVP